MYATLLPYLIFSGNWSTTKSQNSTLLNAFREFIKEMKELNLLYEVEDKFYLTDEYFSKGKCNFNKGEYARIFIKTTQMLYENCSPRKHK